MGKIFFGVPCAAILVSIFRVLFQSNQRMLEKAIPRMFLSQQY